MPERPYHSEDNFLRKEEAYFKERDAKAKELVDKYDALLIVGGSGPIVDLVNNQRLHDLILGFYDADKLIGAECYGVTCLAFARNWEDRKSIISGKHVTGHCIEYDYKYGTGFMGTVHARAIRRAGGVLVGAVGSTPDSSRRAADRGSSARGPGFRRAVAELSPTAPY